ncbi:MAG: urocanate hydratase [Thermoplasmatota archaeon]
MRGEKDRFGGAPTGLVRSCKGWPQEAALRLLFNNVDRRVAEKPEELVVYGGTGRAARSIEAFDTIASTLPTLADDETLVVQSGKPVAVFRTHEMAPRVLIANSLLVPHWADWATFRDLEAKGLTMYGQMTAGSWAYIGSQGIVQGTFETLAELARQHYSGDLAGRIVLTAGLGGMGGAQPLAVTMNGGVCIAVEVDEQRLDRRVETGWCMAKETDPSRAIARVKEAARLRRPLSIGLLGNAAETHPAFVEAGFVPDVVTDQTSAHDELNGYVPAGLTLKEAAELRSRDPGHYRARAWESMGRHWRAVLTMQARGAIAFDYGNNIRAQVQEHAGIADAFAVGGFVPLYIRPMFCEGKGPFRWLALSGDSADIIATDRAMLDLFPHDTTLRRWIPLAEANVPFQGLPARVCWLGYGDRAKAALRMNEMVAAGTIGPIAVTRDHLDSGSVASPYRETEGMKDGSDAIGDWPILNALLNTAAGADIVSVHHGGGVGIGYSLHAGMHVVLDGSERARKKAERVFTTDPGMGVVRHADAGYPRAIGVAHERGIRMPMLDRGGTGRNPG